MIAARPCYPLCLTSSEFEVGINISLNVPEHDGVHTGVAVAVVTGGQFVSLFSANQVNQDGCEYKMKDIG